MITKIDEFKIIKLYQEQKLSCKKIAEQTKHTRSTISNVLRRNNITQRSISELSRFYDLNEDYFHLIDTERKAYFLGLILADGCVIKNKNELHISLIESDKYLLEELSKDIFISKRLLRLEEIRSDWGKNRTYRFTANNPKIYQDLVNLGCIPNKTFKLKFPTISNHLYNHFIRGYFDGGGCIWVSNKYGCEVSILGTLDIVSNITNILEKESKISHLKIRTKIKCKNEQLIYEVRTSGKVNCLAFASYIYKNSTIFMKRKKEKFTKITERGKNGTGKSNCDNR
jgi:hypothetical protein